MGFYTPYAVDQELTLILFPTFNWLMIWDGHTSLGLF